MNSHEAGGNIFAGIPDTFPEEIEQVLHQRHGLSIKRILSRGQGSPADGWYDQEEDEWVLVLQGEGLLAFADGREVLMKAGDYLFIPAHLQHRVKWTHEEQATVWLAIHIPLEENSK